MFHIATTFPDGKIQRTVLRHWFVIMEFLYFLKAFNVLFWSILILCQKQRNDVLSSILESWRLTVIFPGVSLLTVFANFFFSWARQKISGENVKTDSICDRKNHTKISFFKYLVWFSDFCFFSPLRCRSIFNFTPMPHRLCGWKIYAGKCPIPWVLSISTLKTAKINLLI